eukprot:9473032-Lingulodinium_polyedra.AAC.1
MMEKVDGRRNRVWCAVKTSSMGSIAKYLENRAEVPQTFDMRTMLAMGSMQNALEDHEPHLGYCKARGLQQWARKDYTC